MLISVILTVFLCVGSSMLYERLHSFIGVKAHDSNSSTKELTIIQAHDKEEIFTTKDCGNDTWQLEIPTIGLTAPISEGTTQEVMREYVGHFENTNVWNGNIGLAAHNRRIPNKLF